MTMIGTPVSRPIPFAGGVLDRYRHVCAFVNSREEEDELLEPFVRDGFASGDTMLYVVDPRNRANVVSRLRHAGFDMPRLLARHQCEVRTWQETYLRQGFFDRDRTLDLLDEVFGVSPKPRVRLIADMGWAAEANVGDALLEYEAQANAVQPKYEHVAICVYDTARFGADVLIDVLRTHPVALIGGVLQANPFFMPLPEYLTELAARDRQPIHA